MSVMESIVVYGCEIWSGALKMEKGIGAETRSPQSNILSSVSSRARIATVVPIDLLAQERSTSMKEEMKLGEMRQRMKPGNSLAGIGKIVGIGRAEKSRQQGSYRT